MSFELGVWFAPSGMTLAEADARYDRLLDEVSAVPAAGMHPQVAAFHRELTARYPGRDQLAGDEIDASPWSSEFTTTEDAMVVSISGRPSTVVAPFVRELAARHGLVVFDPQDMRIDHPETMRAGLRAVMWTADGSQRDDPGPDTIGAVLAGLTERNHYAILERGPSYVQTMWCRATRHRPEHYDLEHREDGDPDRHFRVEVHHRADLVTAFTGSSSTTPPGSSSSIGARSSSDVGCSCSPDRNLLVDDATRATLVPR